MRLGLLFAMLLAASAQADITIYRLGDGSLMANTKNGMEKVVIVELPIVGIDGPTDPDKPKDDKFGLIKVSKEAADGVPEYADKAKHRKSLGMVYSAIGEGVKRGTITNAEVKASIDAGYLFWLGSDAVKWAGYKVTVTKAFNDHPDINDSANAAIGLEEISLGLLPASERNKALGDLNDEWSGNVRGMFNEKTASESWDVQAINVDGWAKLLELFLKLLPILLEIFKGG